MLSRKRLWPIYLLLLVVAGCGDGLPEAVAPASGDSQAADSAAPVENAASVESAAPAAGIPIRLASWEEVEQLVASQNGKVVVLDVWSTWCVPCLREFPGLVALHDKHGDRVACMSLNCNFTGAAGETPEDSREEIAAFLQKQKATFENVISTTPDEQLYEVLGAAAVPVVRVYDKQGQLRKQFVNDDNEYGDKGFTYEQHIEPLVAELMNE